MVKQKIYTVTSWFEQRFPFKALWDEHAAAYYVPRNLNIWYVFGSLAVLVLIIQIVTGIWLTMFYTPTAKEAFASVEYIMRDVRYGWLIRYMHSTGASAFFIVIYLHMFRSIMYGSYKKPREFLWFLGMLLFLLLLMEAFFGYLLPWGQMSYWGAQVITSLFGSIPYVGDTLLMWLRGDYNVSDSTLHRFFALHVVAVPLMILVLVWMHILALHRVGSNNPEGFESKNNPVKPSGHIPLHPYYTTKDLVASVVFLILFAIVVFFFPEMGGYFLEYANFTAADPLVTPEHIAPVWYMTPFYAILRAIPHKLTGITAMYASVLLLFFLPWLDRSRVRSVRYRGYGTKVALTVFVISFIGLGYLGIVPVTPVRQLFAQILTAGYFSFFVFMPFYTHFERVKSPPKGVT